MILHVLLILSGGIVLILQGSAVAVAHTGVVGGVLKVTDAANDQPGFCELCMDSYENLKLV